MQHYFKSVSDVLSEFGSGTGGLTQAEAAKRAGRDGPNKLVEPLKTPLMKRFVAQLMDPMIVILIVAAVVSGITAAYSGESPADVLIIVAVVLINAILGVYQESKAEAAIEALQKMSAAMTKVLRDGTVHVIPSAGLVAGDIILLEAGDAVPADGRVIECASMKVEEAAMTGESVPVDKTDHTLEGEGELPLGDRNNMVYMGGTVVYGRGRVVITDIGMATEMGKIAGVLAAADTEKTPLQRKLAQLSKILTVVVVGICIFMFAFRMLIPGSGPKDGGFMVDTFMIAVSLAVAAIPEGLAMVVTIVLSVGVTAMSRKNAVIRRLTAVETLGCAQIICSDKTGTLTQNKMTVTDVYADDVKFLAKAMAMSCDASLDENHKAVGEPTECALVNYALTHEINKDLLEIRMPRVGEAPFDSVRKMMTTVHKDGETIIQYTKGAPDEVLRCCSHLLKGGVPVPMTDEDRKAVLAQNKAFADKALRVLGGAYRLYDTVPKDAAPESLEVSLTFLGLVGMIDPVRPEVLSAIGECKSAGIRPIMITGDHRDTAVAIARELGILTNDDQAVTGAQLDAIPDDVYGRTIGNYSVYARVKPENKVRIVNTWRKNGYVCAMTGDGVNDSPSIKSADIGIGMGITGTDVTKNVADMVLADDNFATIVSAVGEGRKIFDNIRKAVQFLLASNLSEVVSVFVATILGFVVLKPVHLLWINLITDTFPALALGMEKGEPDAMKRPPRDPKEGLFARGLGAGVLYQGIMISALVLVSYFVGHFMESGRWEIVSSPDGMTMAFLTMSMAEIFHSFNMRSEKKSMFQLTGQNVVLWAAMAGSFLLTVTVIYVPFLSKAFEFRPVSLQEFGMAVLLAFAVVPVVEAVKLIQRHTGKG